MNESVEKNKRSRFEISRNVGASYVNAASNCLLLLAGSSIIKNVAIKQDLDPVDIGMNALVGLVGLIAKRRFARGYNLARKAFIESGDAEVSLQRLINQKQTLAGGCIAGGIERAYIDTYGKEYGGEKFNKLRFNSPLR